MKKIILYFLFSFTQLSLWGQISLHISSNLNNKESSAIDLIPKSPILKVQGLENKEIEGKINFQLISVLNEFLGFPDHESLYDSSLSFKQVIPTKERYREFGISHSGQREKLIFNYSLIKGKFLIINVGEYYFMEDEMSVRCESDSLLIRKEHENSQNFVTNSYCFDITTGNLLSFWDFFISEDKRYEFIRTIDDANKENDLIIPNYIGPCGLKPWSDSFEIEATKEYDYLLSNNKISDTITLEKFIAACQKPYLAPVYYDRIGSNPNFLIFLDTTYCQNHLVLKAVGKMRSKGVSNTIFYNPNISDEFYNRNNDIIYYNIISKEMLKPFFKSEYFNLIFNNE